jgi:hypothetical protein
MQRGTTMQAPHRRSTSFGGNGFALPGDAADLLRSDLVTSKVGPRSGCVDLGAQVVSEFVQRETVRAISYRTYLHPVYVVQSGNSTASCMLYG